jgi:hypothetical protein
VTTLEDAYAEATKPIQEAIAAELSARQAQSAESNKAAVEKAKSRPYQIVRHTAERFGQG